MVHLIPLKIAFLLFPIVALIISLPFMIYQYRKYKYFNRIRALVIYSFILFLMSAFFLVILPLPSTRDVASLQKSGTQHYQLVPFQFVKDFIRETKVEVSHPLTYIKALKEPEFLQAAFNAILLLPLGVYLRYHFNKGLKATVIITFLTSLFFEITQGTALYGYYNAPYRLFDVDDLILNTLGGFLGYIIAPLFTFFLPKAEDIDKSIKLNDLSVSFIRRGIAFFIDWTILSIILNFISGDIKWIGRIVLIFIYFMVVQSITKGKTLGKSVVKIKVKGKGNNVTFKELFIRYGLLYYVILGIPSILNYLIQLQNTGEIPSFAYLYIGIFIIYGGYIILLIIHFIANIFSKNKVLIYEKISKTKNVIDTN